FVSRHDIHHIIACHRFERLAALLRRLREDVPAHPGQPAQRPSPARALDYGAGSGILAAWLRDEAHLSVAATDLSPATRARLEAQGFPPPQDGERFDLIL